MLLGSTGDQNTHIREPDPRTRCRPPQTQSARLLSVPPSSFCPPVDSTQAQRLRGSEAPTTTRPLLSAGAGQDKGPPRSIMTDSSSPRPPAQA